MQDRNTLDYILRNVSPSLRESFYKLRNKIQVLEDVTDKMWGERYCNYYVSLIRFVEMEPQSRKNRLLVRIKMGDRQIDDDRGWTSPVPKKNRWGVNIQFEVTDIGDIDYALHLVRQAYDFVLYNQKQHT